MLQMMNSLFDLEIGGTEEGSRIEAYFVMELLDDAAPLNWERLVPQRQ